MGQLQTIDYNELNKKVLMSAGKGVTTGATLGSAIGPWGTAIGGAIGGAIGTASGIINKKSEIENINESNALIIQNDKANALMLGNNIVNRTQTPYYALGGKLKQLASDTKLAFGNTHEQGGIKLANGEIENKEVIVKDMVFSNRLKKGDKTYAELAKGLGEKKGAIEKKLNLKDKLTYNTQVKEIDLINNEVHKLFDEQAIEAANYPDLGNTYAYGNNDNYDNDDDYVYSPSESNDVSDASDIDIHSINRNIKYRIGNTGNNIKLNFKNGEYNDTFIAAGNTLVELGLNELHKNMKLPQKELNKYVNYDKNLNIDATLQRTATDINSASKQVMSNTSDANVALAKNNKLVAAGLEATNQVYQTKANSDREITNQEKQTNAAIEAGNNEISYQNKMHQYNKDVQTDVTVPSQINADLYNKANNLRTLDKQAAYQQEQLALQRQLYGTTGARDTSWIVGDFSDITSQEVFNTKLANIRKIAPGSAAETALLTFGRTMKYI